MSAFDKLKRYLDIISEKTKEGTGHRREMNRRIKKVKQEEEVGATAQEMIDNHPLKATIQDATGTMPAQERKIREEYQGPIPDPWDEKVAQGVGAGINDILSDGTRTITWYINAPQAVVDAAGDMLTHATNPDVYKTSEVINERTGKPFNFNRGDRLANELEYRQAKDQGLIDEGGRPKQTYSFNANG